MHVSFFKKPQINSQYRKKFYEYLDQLITGDDSLVLGHYCKEFEKEFARTLGASHCNFVSNGLDALSIALRAVGVQADDVVIVPNHTYIATWIAPLSIGCNLIVAPVSEIDLLLEPSTIEKYITSKVRCIIPVHLYGNACQMQKIMCLGEKHSLVVVEDAAQAHGARSGDKYIGNWGDATCFSFYPTKNLGALGEAGAVTTNDPRIASFVQSYKNYGRSLSDPSLNTLLGSNHRGDEIQAAFLTIKLMALDKIIKRRHEIIQRYEQRINGSTLPFKLLPYHNCQSSPHLAVVRTENKATRDSLAAYLHAKQIDAPIHYKRPCHTQPCIDTQRISIDQECKEQALKISETILSIPMSEVHTNEEIDYVIETLCQYES